MSSLLTWRSAIHDDRRHLCVFECTEPARKTRSGAGWTKLHPKMWELEVQSAIRSLRPPLAPPEFVLTGWDDQGLAAVLSYEELDGPGQVELYLAAVARRLRGKGGGWADEMVEQTLDAITGRAFEAGVDVIQLSTLVHERNAPSQTLCRRYGMKHTGNETDVLQQWTAEVFLAGADPVV